MWIWIHIERTSVSWFFLILLITHCSVFEINFFFFKSKSILNFFQQPKTERFFRFSKLLKAWNWSFCDSLNFQNTLQCLLWKEQANNWHYHKLVLSVYLHSFNTLTRHSIFGVDTWWHDNTLCQWDQTLYYNAIITSYQWLFLTLNFFIRNSYTWKGQICDEFRVGFLTQVFDVL